MGLFCLMAGAILTACGGDGPTVLLVAEELASPAGVGSGEPFLSSAGDTVLMSWLEAVGGRAHELRFASFHDAEWSEPAVIASSERFFVNWADFPSVAKGAGGGLWAHWLERGPGGGYDYGIRIAHSSDGGASWSQPWTPHEDGTPTEHGFVSSVPVGGERGFLWLDGRQMVDGDGDASARQEMALYFRTVDQRGAAGAETLVDGRVCDCCQTDMALTSGGPVAVYRDRSPEEIRDIRITRLRDGAWSEGEIVHEDGWETGACPVNGPSVAARGGDVAVAWFTAAGGVPHVKAAFSDDAGGSFRNPVVVDDGRPAGRVDVVMLEDGAVLVSWLERSGGESAEVRVRRVEASGRLGESLSVSISSGDRASGFPRLTEAGDGSAIVAWTDVAEIQPQVRVARIRLETSTREER